MTGEVSTSWPSTLVFFRLMVSPKSLQAWDLSMRHCSCCSVCEVRCPCSYYNRFCRPCSCIGWQSWHHTCLVKRPIHSNTDKGGHAVAAGGWFCSALSSQVGFHRCLVPCCRSSCQQPCWFLPTSALHLVPPWWAEVWWHQEQKWQRRSLWSTAVSSALPISPSADLYPWSLPRWMISEEQSGPTIPQKRWWSLSVPPIPHLQRWCLGCIAPILSGIKTEKKIQTSVDCFTSNASFVQTEY